jgi:hypothetical protein
MEETPDFSKGRMSDFIFVSSVQKELQAERQAVRDFVRGDALLRRETRHKPDKGDTR